jgi:hypothetical protein
MKRIALALVAITLAGCGGGPRVTHTRDVAAFDRVVVGDSIDVEVVRGDPQVEVYAGEDVMDRVRTESSGGELRVRLVDRGIVIGPDPLGDVRVRIATDRLEGVEIHGSGDVALTGVDEERLALEVRGAGEIDAAGTVGHLDATIQGAGEANLSELAARTAEVLVQGAADADLNVADELEVTVQGAADVSYRGDPVVRSDVDGVGDVQRIGP